MIDQVPVQADQIDRRVVRRVEAPPLRALMSSQVIATIPTEMWIPCRPVIMK